jgi:hypothetical protein
MRTITAVLLSMTVCANSAFAANANVNIQRWIKGSVEYRSIADGTSTGSEEWRITVHPDGSRTLTTTNRVDSDDTHRTVVLRVAKNFRPLHLYSLFWFAGAWVGTSLITVEGDTLSAVALTPDGRITQEVTVPDRFSFIPHPLQSNAWQVGAYNGRLGGEQALTVYDLQTRLNGPGNLLGRMYEMNMVFIGREQVTVPAGTFDTDHFRTASAVDLYVTGPDLVLVKFVWPAAGQEYVLTSLDYGK